MSLTPSDYPGLATGLVTGALNNQIHLSYGAFSAAGTPVVLIPNMAAATLRQFLMLGTGSASMSTTTARNLAKNPDGTPITMATQSQRLNLATGLVTYFTNIPSTGDGNYCYGFGVGGVYCEDIVDVSLIRMKRGSSTTNTVSVIKNINTSVQIGGPNRVQPGNQPTLALNGSNQILLQDGTTALSYSTNTIVVCQPYGVIFGSIQTPDSTDAAGAGDYLELVIRYR